MMVMVRTFHEGGIRNFVLGVLNCTCFFRQQNVDDKKAVGAMVLKGRDYPNPLELQNKIPCTGVTRTHIHFS